jgi:hypothetical protein
MADTRKERKELFDFYSSKIQSQNRAALASERESGFALSGLKFSNNLSGIKYKVFFIGNANFKSSKKNKNQKK